LGCTGSTTAKCWTGAPAEWLPGCRAEIQRQGRARFIGFSTHATTDLILEAINTGEFDYVNLHWYFVNDLNWRRGGGAGRDMGVFIISPNDKGGSFTRPAEAGRSLRAADSHAVQ